MCDITTEECDSLEFLQQCDNTMRRLACWRKAEEDLSIS